MLEAINYTRGSLQILDQQRLPHEEVYIDIQSPQNAWDAIKSMQVRGAPAIAIVACLSLAVICVPNQCSRFQKQSDYSPVKTANFISHSLKYLVTSRPTAVNLADAAIKLERVAYAAANLHESNKQSVNEAYIAAIEQMLLDDVLDNTRIGHYGAEWIMQHARSASQDRKLRVLTHCNTG